MGTPKSPGRKPADDGPRKRRPWEQPELDHVLNAILAVDNEDEFDHAMYQQSDATDRGHHTDHSTYSGAEPAKMKLWKLATRYYNWDYQPHPVRVNRHLLLWTYAELRVMRWAFDPAQDGQTRDTKPTIQYIARLLCRGAEEVYVQWLRMYGGLGLRQPPMDVSTP